MFKNNFQNSHRKATHILFLSYVLISLSFVFVVINIVRHQTIIYGDLIGVAIFLISLIVMMLVLIKQIKLAKLTLTFILPLAVFANIINQYSQEFSIIWIPIALLAFESIIFVAYDYDSEKPEIIISTIYLFTLLFITEYVLFSGGLVQDEALWKTFNENKFPIKFTQIVVFLFQTFILYYLTHFNSKYRKALTDDNVSLQLKQMKLMKKLSKLDSQFNTINHTLDIFTTDQNGNISYANELFCKNIQYKFRELIGKNPRIFNSGYHDIDFFNNLWNTIKSGETWRGEIKNIRKDGTEYWSEAVISPVYTSDKELYGYIAIMFDITNIKENELKLNALNNSNFNVISSISHDLKTPIENIKYLIQMLINEDKISKSGELEIYQHIIQSCNDSSNYIRDLTEFAEIEHEIQRLHKEETEINGFISKIVDTYRKKIEDSGVNLKLKLSEQELICEIDQVQLKRVILNLLSNAMKFTPEGGSITISTYSREIDKIRIEVTDNGIGIPIKWQPVLFEKFTKASRIGLNGEKSTGLGMSIIRNIIEAHGGKISFVSGVGNGTTFFIDL